MTLRRDSAAAPAAVGRSHLSRDRARCPDPGGHGGSPHPGRTQFPGRGRPRAIHGPNSGQPASPGASWTSLDREAPIGSLRWVTLGQPGSAAAAKVCVPGRDGRAVRISAGAEPLLKWKPPACPPDDSADQWTTCAAQRACSTASRWGRPTAIRVPSCMRTKTPSRSSTTSPPA